MLLIDGVKYELWTPTSEDALEQMVKEHAQDIFGAQSIYFDAKQKLKSEAGIGSIPDGYALVLSGEPHWYIVEVELSSHPVFEHIVPQVTKFTGGIKNPLSQQLIVDIFYDVICKDEGMIEKVKSKIGSTEIYKFISKLVSQLPKLVVVIDKETEELSEAIDALKLETEVVEFLTFAKSSAGISQHAHLFEPLELDYSVDPIYRFLEELRRQFAERKPMFKPSRVYQRYGFIPMEGHEKVHTEWLFWGKVGLGVELHLQRDSREENLRLFKRLESVRDELEKNIGEPLFFEDKWGKKWARVYTLRKPIELTDELREWAVDTMVKFCEIFQPLLDEIDR